MAEKEILPKIFVVYKNGSIGEHSSEEKALNGIREHEYQGSEVAAVIIGHKLDMVTSVCEVVHCFTKKGRGSSTCKVPEDRLDIILDSKGIRR